MYQSIYLDIQIMNWFMNEKIFINFMNFINEKNKYIKYLSYCNLLLIIIKICACF